METIGSLNLRSFKLDHKGAVVESTKTGVPEAVHIPYEAYMASKPYLSQARVQTVPYNGHEVLEQIISKINQYVPDKERKVGYITVFKHHLDIHGYVEKANKASTQYPILTPEVPVSDLAFSRIMANIHILGNEKYGAHLAMKWEPNYFQVAIGLNVHMCDNFNIFGGKMYSTGQKLNYDGLLSYTEEQLLEIEKSFGTDIATVKSLIDTPLNDSSVKLLIGDMSLRYAEDHAILGIQDITELTRSIVAKKKKGVQISNMWDFTNHGTHALHFNRTSGDSTLETIARFNQYILEMQAKNKARKS